MTGFSFKRLYSLLRKEWIQVRRDRMTLRLIIALPIMQLFLFGYAINSNPKHLPTGLLLAEPSKYERTIVSALQNTGYYDVRLFSSEAEAERAIETGQALFVVNVPANFDRSVDRGEQPQILIDADATDPTAIGNATAALSAVVSEINRDLPPIRQGQSTTQPFQFVLHARYNPEQLTVLNVVPGLTCIVLLMSTLLITTLSITRERERGTMENLMAMPVRPIEIMLAKIVPYVIIGYVQVILILVISSVVFQLPIRGSIPLLLLALGSYIASNLALGLAFSTVATSQMQAQQLAQFTLLPSVMLSGFMFPFAGMPIWAQWLGEVFPTTHAIRIVRGVLLKGNGFATIAPELWPIALFTLAVLAAAVWSYRETLD
ncbi:ABC transporter permease [Bradyrhizobium sp. 2TAF24]|uniref:ABC transporter permease n=1 Tax=Bradyrhizobium sp. 2TAF24 TaxID=3233011 RepID=UPI003F91E337